MNTVFFKKEIEKAYDYFTHAIIEIDNNGMFEEDIKDLLRFLHAYEFSIEDVLEFYSYSDLQDEDDILRLMEYIRVTNDPRKHCPINNIINPMASNRNGYLIIINQEDEEY